MKQALRCLAIPGLMVLVLAGTGCETVVAPQTISIPVAPTAAFVTQEDAIFVARVVDNRQFAADPNRPSQPSLAPAAMNVGLSDLQPERVIGRQRGREGEFQANVVLPQGETVADKMSGLVTTAFMELGYGSGEDESAKYHVDVIIEEFWGWSSPRPAATAFLAQIYATVVITQEGRTLTIKVRGTGENLSRLITPTSWQGAYDIAASNFRRNLMSHLREAGF